MTIKVVRISRFPVKGLGPDFPQGVEAEPGRGLAWDRAFAIALASTRFDADTPQWLPKTSFLMLMRHERLARLETRFDEKTAMLEIFRQGRKVVGGCLNDPVGRAVIEDFFAAYMARDLAGKPRLLQAPPGHMFSDHRNPLLSIISLASINDLERVMGRPLDPTRFRANLLLEGGRPWEEFTWTGKKIRIGGALLEITQRIERCAAVDVDPTTGERDTNIPLALKKAFGHKDFGVYAQVLEKGEIKVENQVAFES